MRLQGDPAPQRLPPPELSDEVVRGLAAEMDAVGFAIVPGYVQPELLQQLQTLVSEAVAETGGQYVVFDGPQSASGAALHLVGGSDRFIGLMRRLFELGSGRSAPAQRVHQVLRCLAGETGQRQSNIFHFDSYLVSAIIPIAIPRSPASGRLVLAPNLRRVRRRYLFNLVDKLLVDNPFTQRLLKALAQGPSRYFQRVEMNPGDLYLFWGYRSLHTNEACRLGDIRATAVFHYGDPHAESRLRKRLGRASY